MINRYNPDTLLSFEMEPDLSMLSKRGFLFLLTLFAMGLSLLGLPGCSMGFTNLHPGENSVLYNRLFEDVINTYDEPHWLWVRGTISGDLNGNGIVEEEVILATIQQGTTRDPGPIEKAFLVICEVDPDGNRKAIARTLLFDSNPIPGSPKPVNDLGMVTEAPFTRARAQMVQDKVTLKETVLVYFWSDPTPSSVWYVGFALNEDGSLFKNFETTMYQATPGFLTANLDRSIEASPFGYQLLFSVSAIPPEIFAKLGAPHEAPLWGHVYARGTDGVYRQADERFGEHYRRLENSWNQLYLKAVLNNLPSDELAWFEYHMGIMNHYSGESDMAKRFLQKAEKNARDDMLVRAVGEAVKTVGTGER